MSQTGIVRKRKTHRGRVTEVNLAYEGGITIDRRLMGKADFLPFEQVQVLDIGNASVSTEATAGAAFA
ncbi:MAG: aspartate 1-decarboxylase [Dehalococcoidales bacterium]